MVGSNFGDVKLKRSDKVRSLASIHKGITINKELVTVNTVTLFNRIICVVQTSHERSELFKYELAPKPLSLFDDISMRKSNKAELSKVFEKKVSPLSQLPSERLTFVIDGGFLLHRVLWDIPSTYSDICKMYVAHVVNKYSTHARPTVVFDGYGNIPNTKDAEHARRISRGRSLDIIIDEAMACSSKPSEFLANEKNKVQLIALLSKKLNDEGINVRQAKADADVLIVTTAIDLSKEHSDFRVVIVGEDTDLLVLIVALVPNTQDILLLKPFSGKQVARVYSSSALQVALGPLTDNILFAHAVSGCDTTSAPFGKGKRRTIQLLENSQTLRDTVSVFNNRFAQPDDIAKAGEKFLLALYAAGSQVETLDKQRFYSFGQTIGKQSVSKTIQLARLPPTSASAREHSFRVFHQVQQWMGIELPATQWGWKMCDNLLQPILTCLPPAPDNLLELVSCNCKTGRCTSCNCRKAGLKCTPMCRQCRGVHCTNSPDVESVDGLIDNFDDIDTTWNIHGIEYTGMEVDV